MNTNLKNRKDLSDLQKEAIHKYDTLGADVFFKWIDSLSFSDKLIVWQTLQIGIYDSLINNPINLIISFIPKELMYAKTTTQVVNHYFKFELNIHSDDSVMIAYRHYLSEIPNEEIGGMTNIWCNPFEDNKVCDYLIERECNESNFKQTLIEIYEFIVEHNIIK